MSCPPVSVGAIECLALLASGLPVDARHGTAPGRLLAGLYRHQARPHCRALGPRHCRMAPDPALGSALDRPAAPMAAPHIARPVHPLGPEVAPRLPPVRPPAWFITCRPTLPRPESCPSYDPER